MIVADVITRGMTTDVIAVAILVVAENAGGLKTGPDGPVRPRVPIPTVN